MEMNHPLKIGEVARATGLSIDAIRFYERERLAVYSKSDL